MRSNRPKGDVLFLIRIVKNHLLEDKTPRLSLVTWLDKTAKAIERCSRYKV